MKKLSFHHTLMIYFIFIAVSSVSVLPSALTKKAGTAGILAPLCALPLAAVFFLGINHIYKNYSSLSEFLIANFGEKISKILSVLIVFQLALCSVMLLKSFGSRIEQTLSYVGREISIIVLMALAFFGVASGFKACVRTVAICSALLVLSVILMFLFSVKGLDFTLVLPLKKPDLSAFCESLVFPVGSVCFMSALIFFYKPDFKGKAFFFATVPSLIFMSAVSLIIICTFSLPVAEKISFPFFSLIKSADTFSVSEHFDAFFTANWLIFSAALLCFVFYSACEGIRQVFNINNQNSFLKMSLLFGVFICALALFNFLDSEKIIVFDSFILPYFNIILGFVLPSFLVIISKIKQKVHKNVTTS